ncbi:MAG: sensor histidine kinase [Clostridium sp.]
MKSSSSKIIINIISILIIICVSIGIIATYPTIKNIAKEKTYNPYEETNFISDLTNSNSALYYMLKTDKNEKIKPEDIFLEINENNSSLEEDGDVIYYKERLNNYIYNYMKDLDKELRNLDYYALDKESGTILSRQSNKLGDLLQKEEINKSNEVQNFYDFYIVINYDEKGKLSISKINGGNEKIIYNTLINENIIDEEDNYGGEVVLKYNPIKNATFIYGVPKDVIANKSMYFYRDRIYNYITNAERAAYIDSSDSFIIIAVSFIVLSALLITYKREKDIIGFNKISRIPLEFHLIIGSFVLYFIFSAPENIMMESILGKIHWFFGINISDVPLTNSLILVLNLLFWIICFGMLYIYIILIKHIFIKGFKEYIKEDTLVLRIITLIKSWYKRSVDRLLTIDLKDKGISNIIKLVGINLIILVIMSSMWFIGIILAIIYSIYLFIKLRESYTKVSNNYNEICDITQNMAEGNLEVDLERDLGVFNSLKEDLSNIQIGFKKAVDEEVKSARMKTDLISNVSHDLKTPLTSIITYVDLLKNGDLSDEDRKLYLDTLDKKSQRLQALIEDLFEMSKATSGNVKLNIMDVDIVSLMKQIILELSDKIEESELIVKSNFPSEKIVLPLDSQRTFRVFENLIINITKYAMPKSRVYIDIINEEDKVEITLKNMSATEIDFNVEEITERFVRGDKSRNTKGSGLGLAIAKSFVELQGGEFKIRVDGDLFKVLITFDKDK